jgi:hypothetical protein
MLDAGTLKRYVRLCKLAPQYCDKSFGPLVAVTVQYLSESQLNTIDIRSHIYIHIPRKHIGLAVDVTSPSRFTLSLQAFLRKVEQQFCCSRVMPHGT